MVEDDRWRREEALNEHERGGDLSVIKILWIDENTPVPGSGPLRSCKNEDDELLHRTQRAERHEEGKSQTEPSCGSPR